MLDPGNETLYITSAREVVTGGALVALTLVIHAVGMIYTQHNANRFKRRFEQRSALISGIGSLILASWMIVTVHCLEVLMWAVFFQWKNCFANLSTAAYFSFLEYTTVGSAFNLPLNWRLLEGMIATAGLLAFAWSTGVLLTQAMSFQEQQLRLLNERNQRLHRKPPEGESGMP